MISPVRLVIADDAEQLRTLLARALETSGEIEVVGQADDGQAALAAVGDHLPDVLLLDVSMPVLDGLEVLRRVQAEHPDVSVVIFSGYGTRALESTCLSLGAAAYVEKGTPIADLRRVIVSARTER